MIFIDIPFVVENKRIDKEDTRRELAALEIAQSAKDETLLAIYNRKPEGVLFENSELKQAQSLEKLLLKLNIPHRMAEVSEFA